MLSGYALKRLTPFLRASFLLLIATLTLPLVSTAAESKATIRKVDNMVVTASRIPTERSRVGTTTYVITAEEIELRQYRFVLDALRTLPGITITQNGALGGTASVRIRGAAGSETLVLLDGIVVNDPSSPNGGFDFSSLDTSDIETLEVYNGPQSTLHGSDAMGGVINITTKSGAQASPLSGYVEGGSYDSIRGQLESGMQGDVFAYRMSANYLNSDGYSKADENLPGNTEDDGFNNLTLSGQLSAQLSENISAGIIGRYIDTDSDIDFGGGPGNDAPGIISKSKQYWLSTYINTDSFNGTLNNTLRINYMHIEREIDAYFFATKGEQTEIEYQGIKKLSDSYKLLFGISYEEQSIEEPNGFLPKRKLDSQGAFAMLQAAPVQGLTLTAGGRIDDYDQGSDGSGNNYADFSAETTFQFTAAWTLPNENTILRSSWGQAFKAPTIFQLTYADDPNVVPPNGALKPETRDGWDAGIEHAFAFLNTNLQLTYFYSDAKDLINYVNTCTPPVYCGTYKNIDRSSSNGVELSISADILDNLSLALSGSYISAEDKSTNEQLMGVPKRSAYANLTWRPTNRSNIYTNLTLTSDRKAFGGSQLTGYGVAELGGSFEVSEKFSIYGRLENMFDNEYQEVMGYGTSDRAYYAGIRMRL
ncbi:MAG: TonB-dependent receptor [Gammaproteobacteria bacterium]|nr:TonB-dependent receptor [Gammaproteobacteria bacterium]MCP4090230.1 TonB-dependent receptor [Gammaproteobacteria bacterium]MCP4832658.1 TonB-dependent receptor [Gammaproteobacteria bacterium]MCP4930102.1 TonB-dependent receptor [Gammaproteobacteria bacterium]